MKLRNRPFLRYVLAAMLTFAAPVATSLVAHAALRAQLTPPAKPPLEKLGENAYRLGALHIDTAARELQVPGVVNDVMTIEFLAGAKGGAKDYEALLELETDAISLNAALLLLGLDPAHAKPSKRQFDPAAPAGDPVDLFVSWGKRRVAVDELLLDRRTKKTIRGGSWVYTGSTFVETGEGRRFMAELDGVLVGLMHGPSSLIENPSTDTVGGFGAIILNPAIGLTPDTAITLTIKAKNRR